MILVLNVNMNKFNPFNVDARTKYRLVLNPAALLHLILINAFAFNPINSQMMTNPQAMMTAQLMNSMNEDTQQNRSTSYLCISFRRT